MSRNDCSAVIAAMLGADIIRVHDVSQSLDAIAMVNALNETGLSDEE